MGLGDSVPGISGGTIAVITNIYDQLIYSLRALDLHALKLLGQGRIREGWQYINGFFLLTVALGMLSGLLLSANTVLYLLETERELLLAFFVGLVLASVFLLRHHYSLRSVTTWLALLLGVLLTVGVGLLDGLQATLSVPYLFFCGALAICAMILPGLSGAFILLLLGAYEHMLEALVGFQWLSIIVFASGAACGLLAFSRLLAWLLSRFHALAYAFISGLLLGSLYILWPWQQVVSSYTDAAGVSHPLRSEPVWPLTYAGAGDAQAGLGLAVLLMIAGAALVLTLHFVSNRYGK